MFPSGATETYLGCDPMGGSRREKITVRWIDAKTGEASTGRMNDPSAPPGKGILEVARAIGRLMAAQQIEAEAQLLKAVSAELQTQAGESLLLATPRLSDQLTLNGVNYSYDGSTDDGEHLTRLKGQDWDEALVSLRRGSAAADWILRQLVRQP
jgi:hypothetical protein